MLASDLLDIYSTYLSALTEEEQEIRLVLCRKIAQVEQSETEHG